MIESDNSIKLARLTETQTWKFYKPIGSVPTALPLPIQHQIIYCLNSTSIKLYIPLLLNSYLNFNREKKYLIFDQALV